MRTTGNRDPEFSRLSSREAGTAEVLDNCLNKCLTFRQTSIYFSADDPTVILVRGIRMAHEKPPDAELEVLACLRRLKKATAREVKDAVSEYRPMAHGSVLTLLKRLESRSLVTKKKGTTGKAFVYRPTRLAESTYNKVLTQLLHRVFAGDSVALVASLFERKLPDPQELADLQQLLDELKEKSAEKGGKP